jgi:hypothetical protein
MVRIDRLGVLSFAKFRAIQVSFVGLVCGIVYAFGGLLYDLATAGGVNEGTALAFLALIGMPFLSGAFGAVAGIVEALLYNLYAGTFRGVTLDLEQGE